MLKVFSESSQHLRKSSYSLVSVLPRTKADDVQVIWPAPQSVSLFTNDRLRLKGSISGTRKQSPNMEYPHYDYPMAPME